MKKLILIAALALMVVAANAQGKQDTAKKQRVYLVSFTANDLALIKAECDSTIKQVSRSQIPTYEGMRIISWMARLEAEFQNAKDSQDRQAADLKTKKKE